MDPRANLKMTPHPPEEKRKKELVTIEIYFYLLLLRSVFCCYFTSGYWLSIVVLCGLSLFLFYDKVPKIGWLYL